ncbi:hypothetical protein D3C77_487610 [compost metagenome]
MEVVFALITIQQRLIVGIFGCNGFGYDSVRINTKQVIFKDLNFFGGFAGKSSALKYLHIIIHKYRLNVRILNVFCIIIRRLGEVYTQKTDNFRSTPNRVLKPSANIVHIYSIMITFY